MRVAIIYNKDLTGVINVFGMQNKEVYNPATIKRVAHAIEKNGHHVQVIDGNINVIEKIQSFMPRVVEGEKPGMVFNMAYGIQGESRYTHIPSLLEMLGIPYIGSNPSGHALALDKVITKIILEKNGIPTPNFWVFSSPDEDMSEVIYPVIVKPKMESVSFGLKVVYDETSLKEAVTFVVSEFHQQALVEQFIRGREFCVGLLGNNPVEAFPVLEIDLDGDPDGIQTVDDKQKIPKEKICPANIDPKLSEEMISISQRAFQCLHLRDFARVDLRLDESNNVHVLEINSMASLGKTGSYVTAAREQGYTFDQLVNRILDVATVRYFAEANQADTTTHKRIPVKTRIRGFIRSRQENAEKILEQLTNINTYVRNAEGVNQAGSIIGKQLLQIGFKPSVIPQVEIGNTMYFSNTDTDDIDFLFLGNLDTDTRIKKQRSFQRTEMRISGSGVWESKGGLIVMMLALQALRFVKVLKKLKIGILLTTDDTLQGRISRQLIINKSLNAKTVLGLHGGSIDSGMVTSRSGAAVFHFIIKMKEIGTAGDVATVSSIFSGILRSISNLSDEEVGIVIAPSELGFISNITEPYASGEAVISARFNTRDQLPEIQSALKQVLNKGKSKKLYTIQFEGGERRPPLEKSENTKLLWEQVKSLAADLDIRVTEEHRWSSADICFIDQSKSLIDGFGPNGNKETESSEFIFTQSILEKATLLAMTLYHFKLRT
jgi:D-alanine-D-alanine ligase